MDGVLKRASDRGVQIFELDQSAWVSTDELRRKIPDLEKSGVKGWIIDPAGDRLRAIYYRLDGREPRAVFTAETRGNKVLTSHVLGPQEDDHLTPTQLRMVQALQVARQQPIERCTDGPINSVVIPPASPDGPITVYILSSRVKADEFPFGGHQRFDIGKTGKVVAQRRFTNGCLNMSPPPTPRGGEPAIAVVTHLLDPIPTEIHVFNSIAMGRAVAVSTSAPPPAPSDAFRLWLVSGRKISLLNTGPDSAPN